MKKISSICFLLLVAIVFYSSANAGTKSMPVINVQGEGTVDISDYPPMIGLTCDESFSVVSMFAVTDESMIFVSAWADHIVGVPHFYGHGDEPQFRLDATGKIAETDYHDGMGQGAELITALGVNDNMFLPKGATVYFIANYPNYSEKPDEVQIWGSAMVKTIEGANCQILLDDSGLFQ